MSKRDVTDGGFVGCRLSSDCHFSMIDVVIFTLLIRLSAPPPL